MKERAGRLLLEGRLVPGRVRFDGERIVAVERDGAAADPSAPVVAPGLIDLHVHGYGGCDPAGDLAGMAASLAAAGTTSFLATLFPDEPGRLGATARTVWDAAGALAPGHGARVLGLHLEGPFVNPACAGALPRHALCEPSPAALTSILGDGEAGIRTVTLAPELAGADDLVRELVRAGVRVSLGHSRATAAEARRAARAGAVGATHLYNAMAPLHHREAGLVGFALSSDALCAEIIGDLVHVGPEAFALALAARGPHGLALVSDALAGAGSGCEVFESCGQRYRVADGAIWLDRPGPQRRLGGAAASQLEAVRRLVRAGVLGLADALTMASAAPARALGLEAEVGALAPGARADLVLLSGPDHALTEVVLGGRSLPPGGAPGESLPRR